jgi:hypothetical protein
VEDEKDDCPTIAGKVVHNGCPDGDNVGLNEERDRAKVNSELKPYVHDCKLVAKNHNNLITFAKIPNASKVYITISGGLSVVNQEIANNGMCMLDGLNVVVSGGMANKEHSITISAIDKDLKEISLINYSIDNWFPLCK